jgi:hypothetical protein
MSNPTTPFSWQMPTATDLVTDLPADFEVFGQAVATSMADLLGGTSGQILAKNSNTDMDFVWIANDQGDITGITASSPLTGGGTSGAVTVGIQDALTTQKGAVQLSDSTSTTSSILAATPTAVKSAYDLANGAIAKSTVTTAGDIIYRNATVPTRLGIGTAGQVLQVNSGATAPEWATPASSSGPAFFAYRSGNQSITSGTGTKVAFNAESFDTDNCFDSTTNYRFTPTKSGYYQMNSSIECAGATVTRTVLMFYKNGSEYQRFVDYSSTASNLFSGSTLAYFNGSSDYAEVYVQVNGTSLTVNGAVNATTFTGVWIRS